jgi:hypothetical protein
MNRESYTKKKDYKETVHGNRETVDNEHYIYKHLQKQMIKEIDFKCYFFRVLKIISE